MRLFFARLREGYTVGEFELALDQNASSCRRRRAVPSLGAESVKIRLFSTRIAAYLNAMQGYAIGGISDDAALDASSRCNWEHSFVNGVVRAAMKLRSIIKEQTKQS